MLVRILIGAMLYVSLLSAQTELFNISSKEQLITFFKLFNLKPKTVDLSSKTIKMPCTIITTSRDTASLQGYVVNSDKTIVDISIFAKQKTTVLTLKPSQIKPIINYQTSTIQNLSSEESAKIYEAVKNFESDTNKKVLFVSAITYNMSISNIILPNKLESLILKGSDFISYMFAFDGILYNANGICMENKDKEIPVDFERVSDFYSMSRFHPILHRFLPHYGIDLSAKEGSSVYAVMDGIIEDVGYDSIIGNYVKINHQNGYTTLYGHLSKVKTTVKNGSLVHKKETIGLVGHTGLATGAHLHFGVTKNGVNINPADFYSDTKRHVAQSGFFDFVKDAKQKAIIYGN